MSTRTSRGRISRMRPLTMLPSLKSGIGFDITSCMCTILKKGLGRRNTAAAMSHRRINFGGRRPPLQPAETKRHSSCFRGEGQLLVAHALTKFENEKGLFRRDAEASMRDACAGQSAEFEIGCWTLSAGRFPPYLGQHVDLTLVDLSGGFRDLIASRRLTGRTKSSRGK